MVLDPFTSIGLASNIIDFLNFSFKLISETKTIYNSASGNIAEHASLSAIAADLRDYCEDLGESSARGAAKVDPEIGSIASECGDVAEELIGVVTRIQAKREHSKWESFKAAWRAYYHEDEIRRLASRVTDLQSRATIRSLRMLRQVKNCFCDISC